MTPEAFTSLLDTHGPALILFARQWCDAPEDVVQSAFLKLVALRKPPDNPSAWLYRVVRNGAIDAGKSARRRREREVAVARPERWFVETEVEGLDAVVAVSALQELSVELREVIVARLWGGLTFEEIGELVGCGAATAHRRFSTGITALRERLRVTSPSEDP